jgi:hypothetical protein
MLNYLQSLIHEVMIVEHSVETDNKKILLKNLSRYRFLNHEYHKDFT